MMESSATAIAMAAPTILRNLLTSIFIYAYKPLLLLSEQFKVLLQFLSYFLVSIFLFFLGRLPKLMPTSSFFPPLNTFNFEDNRNYLRKPPMESIGGSSGIARALSQLLSIMDELPASSRKYETVKSLAEKLIVGNLEEGSQALREVNIAALSAAFAQRLNKLEVVVMEQESDFDTGGAVAKHSPSLYCRLKWAYRKVGYYCGCTQEAENRSGGSAEKLSAELLWLSEKLAACGSAQESVCRWALASNLARLSLSAEPRLQGSLLRVSAFLLKQVKENMGGEGCERSKREEQRQIKLKMLMSWIPFLCRASGGVDTPAFSLNEKSELEGVLDEIIQSLRKEGQEKVLTLWLHHFTHCSSSNWPNLHSCYARWCQTSRTCLLVDEEHQNHEDIGL